MKSSWLDQVATILHKEAVSEFRGRHGLFTAGLFGLLTVIALVFASFAHKPTAPTIAAMLTVALVFSAVVTVPRTLIAEDEQGTFSLLVLLTDPGAAFFGKMVWNCLQMLVSSALMTVVYAAMSGIVFERPAFFVLSLVVFAVALAVGVSLCGALVIGSSNRWLLAGVVSMPMLIPVVFMGVVALRTGIDGADRTIAGQSLIAMGGYALTMLAAGPRFIAAVWGNKSG